MSDLSNSLLNHAINHAYVRESTMSPQNTLSTVGLSYDETDQSILPQDKYVSMYHIIR